MKKRYIYFSPTHEAKEFKSLADMRDYAQDPAHNGDYYIANPETFRSYHRNRENMLKTYDDSRDT